MRIANGLDRADSRGDSGCHRAGLLVGDLEVNLGSFPRLYRYLLLPSLCFLKYRTVYDPLCQHIASSFLASNCPSYPITRDQEICDPGSHKRVDLERLVIGPQGGVANTVVFIKEISKGKALANASATPLLNQKHCRYELHIVLVPVDANLHMKSSDATLHTIHMEGAATYNLPFPFPNQVIARNFPSSGLVTLRCNGGHVWMNAELFVIPHPYYQVTDNNGRFQLSDVRPGEYELVACT